MGRFARVREFICANFSCARRCFDLRILEAAREFLIAQPDIAMADVARQAGVGMGTLYRRYPAKDALILHLCLDGMQRAEALPTPRCATTANHRRRFASSCTTHSMPAWAPSRTSPAPSNPTDELLALADRAHDAINRLLAWTQTSGAVRDDITAADLLILLGQVRAIPVSSPDLAALQQRSLALALQAVQATNHDALPEPSATWEDIKRRWLAQQTVAAQPHKALP